LVNVGASSAIERFDRFGYPVCTVCGQSVSPLSSEKQRDHFEKMHLERCGRAVTPVGFYADVVADALSLPACPDQATAYSVLEALRIGATRVLDMHMDDLQVLVIGHVDRDEVDGLLWDPMPGGSGLLDQLCERFEEVVAVALAVVEGCPSACATSCIDCLQNFRNGYYHKHLHRKLAQERLQAWGPSLSLSHEIPPKQPSAEPADGTHLVNEAERRLRHLLLAAGFEEGMRGEQLRLDRAIGTTTPDVIYRAPDHGDDEGVCIYLDGLSRHIHGNPATAEQDQRIRSWLRNHGWEVIEIAASDLTDEEAMVRHFRKLAGYLNDSRLREHLRENRAWFASDAEAADRGSRPHLRIVHPTEEEKYVSCVPMIPLRAAAGFFSDPRRIENPEAIWVEVDTSHKLRRGMFVTQVCGKSMEPLIPDGSYCLFAGPVGGKASESIAGTRQGQTVLVELKGEVDPETGHRFTVKRYESEKLTEPDGTWRHTRITLRPLNHQFEPIVLENASGEDLAVIGTFLEVLTTEG
jgi:SOS-response transcriptional repressor LexA